MCALQRTSGSATNETTWGRRLLEAGTLGRGFLSFTSIMQKHIFYLLSWGKKTSWDILHLSALVGHFEF